MARAGSRDRGFALRRLLLVLAALVVLALVVYGLMELFTGPKVGRPSAQQITLVRPNLPPPPPPKPPEKLPEPPKPQEEVKIDQPRPQDEPVRADEPPPAAQLGLDADGTGEGDGFGLAANRGGRDILESGPAIGGGGLGGDGQARAQYHFYRDVITRHVGDVLSQVAELRASDAMFDLALWIDANGRVERIEMGNQGIDAANAERVRKALAAGPALRRPPEGMPQPVRVKVRVQEVG